jgi:hypothetical protein
LARGNLEGLEAWLRERRRALPVEGGSRDLLHDLLLRTDRPAEAAALWEDAFDRGEVGMVGLEIPAALRNVDPFAALFIPARQAIAAYEARRGPDEAPSTQVLDHTVSRILDDGSILMLTHTVLKLSSQEAVEAYGQSGGGGGMLAARTIGADGTVTDVVNLSEAGVGSFPNLTPGCYVETFSARLAPASPMLRGGTDHWRFYFRSRDELMARTEFVLAAPSDYPLDFSPRGSPPPLQERTLDALTLRRWAATDVPPLRSEPLSVSSDAYIPSIRVARGFDWDVAMSGLGEALYASDYVPLEVADFARDLCRGLDRDGCARTVYDWILDEIESGGVTESITSTFQRRSGARARLALAMLEANGFPVELYFATSLERDLVETPVAESSRYYYPVLRVGDTWLTIEADEAPFGFLPPEIRGMPAAVFRPREQAFRTVVLPRGTDEEGFHMRLDLEVDPDTGNVRVEGVMEAHGAFAADFRDGLKERSPADWEGDLTGVAVSPSFPGAEVERIAVEGLEDREGPLRIVFTATARGLALRRGGAILLPPLMPQQFTGGYAPLPSIENPAVSFPPKILDLEVRVRAPGYAPAAPPGAAIDTDWVSFEQTIRETEEGGVLHRRVRIGMGRLEPEQYAPFAQAVRRAESLWNIPFELRRSR